jgi:hypothetical protein
MCVWCIINVFMIDGWRDQKRNIRSLSYVFSSGPNMEVTPLHEGDQSNNSSPIGDEHFLFYTRLKLHSFCSFGKTNYIV